MCTFTEYFTLDKIVLVVIIWHAACFIPLHRVVSAARTNQDSAVKVTHTVVPLLRPAHANHVTPMHAFVY
jgi:hypothetical protein